jgi:hypothetical protein
MLYKFTLTMSLGIIIVCIFKPSVHYVEGIAIVDVTRMWPELGLRHELGLWHELRLWRELGLRHKLGPWLRKGRSSIMSLLV